MLRYCYEGGGKMMTTLNPTLLWTLANALVKGIRACVPVFETTDRVVEYLCTDDQLAEDIVTLLMRGENDDAGKK